MDDNLDELIGRVPYKPQLPTPQQVAAFLAILSLAGPMALGGIPVIPVILEDKKLRNQDEIQQISESSVGVHQTPAEAEESLALSQQRLARVTREVENVQDKDVSEQDIIRAANRVLEGNVEKKLGRKFRSAFTNVAWDTVDLLILLDNEE